MSNEPYTPDEVTVKAAWSEFLYLESHGMKHVDDSDAEFDRFINKVKADARAEGVRETARYIERIAPKGLVDRSGVLADMGIAAERLEHGIHANGRDRIEGEV